MFYGDRTVGLYFFAQKVQGETLRSDGKRPGSFTFKLTLGTEHSILGTWTRNNISDVNLESAQYGTSALYRMDDILKDIKPGHHDTVILDYEIKETRDANGK